MPVQPVYQVFEKIEKQTESDRQQNDKDAELPETLTDQVKHADQPEIAFQIKKDPVNAKKYLVTDADRRMS